jgi:hypothetical protein
MKTVDDCPCAELNEHYPYEGNMTRHKCLLKKSMRYVCDQETTKGCCLFEHMQMSEDLKEFIQGLMT